LAKRKSPYNVLSFQLNQFSTVAIVPSGIPTLTFTLVKS
jgi:hypothetical protein